MGKHEAPRPNCGTCNGSGKVSVSRDGTVEQKTCPTCNGSGTS